MSENPFAAPTPVAPGMSSTKKAPVALTTILIICLVFGILGLMGSCFGSVMLFFQAQMFSLGANGVQGEEIAMVKKMQEYQMYQLIPNFLNFIVAPMLIAGSIGGLARKPWTVTVLGLGLLTAIFYKVVQTGIGTWIQFQTMDMMNEFIPQANNGPDAEVFEGVMGTAMYVGVAFVVLWALAMIGFYAWAWTYIRKDHVCEYLRGA